jgi:uncharacterized membrane protein
MGKIVRSEKNKQRQEEIKASYSRRAEKNFAFLPDPEVLENYNYVVEGSAERILALLEEEQKHRHEWENRALRLHSSAHLLGVVAALLFSVFLIVGITVLGVSGKFSLAVIVSILGFGTLAIGYYGNTRNNKWVRDTKG